jgi:FdhE protein
MASPARSLEVEHPEWRTWLRLLDAAWEDMGDARHEAAVPDAPPTSNGTPLVAGAVFELSRRAAARWVRDLLAVAAENGGAPSLSGAARSPALEPLAALEAAVAADRERLDALAGAAGADREAFAAVMSVAAMPLLQACGRRWSSRVSPGWDRGYCPVCGAWPALAEARGLEHERRLRCARCGGTRDHRELGALVPEGTIETRRADTCAVCRRYVKTVTTLAATPARQVTIQDLATLDLDLAALAHGYEGARGLGHPVTVTIVARRGWVSLAWKR